MSFFKYMAFSVFFVLISTASHAAYFIRKITALRTCATTSSRNLCTVWEQKRKEWIALNNAQQTAAVVAQKNAQKQTPTNVLTATKLHVASQPAHAALAELKTNIPSSDQTQSPPTVRFHC